MISQRFNLFYAGYAAYKPSLHYNREALYGKVSADRTVKGYDDCLRKLKSSIENTEDEAKSNLATAASLGQAFDLSIDYQPKSLSDYFTWLNLYSDAFEGRFPMSRIDHYYYLYGRKNAELICNTGLMQSYLDLHLGTDLKLDIWSGINKCLRDNEYILFKLIAASALLSSEPRQNYFSDHYKLISNEFRPFRNINFSLLPEEQLFKLKEDLSVYESTVITGFKGCLQLLSGIND